MDGISKVGGDKMAASYFVHAEYAVTYTGKSESSDCLEQKRFMRLRIRER